MLFTMLDYPGISYRWNWIKAIPSRIEKLENYELDELLALADYSQREADSMRANLLMVNSWERVNAIQFQDEKEAKEIRAAVQAEKERRSPPPLPQSVTPTTGEHIKEPPTFEQLFVPGTTERVLAAAQKVEISKIEGKTITWNYGGKKGAILALWDAVKAKGFANPDYVTTRIACPVIAQKFGTSVDPNIYDSMARYIKPLKEDIMLHL